MWETVFLKAEQAFTSDSHEAVRGRLGFEAEGLGSCHELSHKVGNVACTLTGSSKIEAANC